MVIAELGGHIDVEVGEPFAVARRSRELSGYCTTIQAPRGITQLFTARQNADGFGGAPRIMDEFRADLPGTYVILFIEGRAWEESTTTATVEVTAS